MTTPATDQVKHTLDLVSIGAAGVINITVLNEYVTLAAGVLAAVWSAIRLVEWGMEKWRSRARGDNGSFDSR